MSKITLYKNCQILEEKNFVVENISDYLTTLNSTALVFDNAQFFKHGLDSGVKIELSQDYLDRKITNNYNYAVIENDEGDKYYYFIREKIWTSKLCIKLILRLDVLNTYNGKYVLTDKTMISRQHKDRFINYPKITDSFLSWLDDFDVWEWGTGAGEIVGVATFYIDNFVHRSVNIVVSTNSGTGADIYNYNFDNETGALTITAYVQGESSPIPQGQIKVQIETNEEQSAKITRKVDFIEEGIDTILFAKEVEDSGLFDNLTDSNKEDSHYLIYKTNNAFDPSAPDSFIYDNAVNVFYTSDSGFTSTSSTGVQINASDLTTLDFFAVSYPTGNDGRKTYNSFNIDYPNPSAPLSIEVEYENDEEEKRTTKIDLIKVNNKRNKQTTISFIKQNDGKIKIEKHELDRANNYKRNTVLTSSSTYIKFLNLSNVVIYKTNSDFVGTNFYYDYVTKNNGSYSFTAGSIDTKTSKPFSEVDRTDTKLLKIVKLPYALFEKNSSGAFEWNSGEGMFRIKTETINNNFIQRGLSLSNGKDYPVNELFIVKPIISKTDEKNIFYESKLLQSNFHFYKFVYDSFNYTIKNELIDIENYYEDDIKATYVVSTNVSSSFLFDFKDSYKQFVSDKDYPYIMIVNRNLEVPIYNNYYLNYLRNGYNYDIKNRQAQRIASAVGAGVGIASTAAGIALSASGYGAAFGAPMIVGGVATTITSLTSAITSSTQADRAIQMKEEQAKNQASSVSGADDIGLLSYYCNKNKAKIVQYNLSEATKEKIYDLFFYCGYKCDYQDIPNINSRLWFNYIQCKPVFEESEFIAKLSLEEKNEIIAKYFNGVTVLHRNTVNSSYKWDFEQNYENWETFLVE